MYDLEMPTSREENLLKQAKRMRQPIPDKIKNKPILKSGLMLYYDSFGELKNDRTESGRIPWSVIIKYCEYYEFDEIQTQNLIYFTRHLNETFNNWLDKNKG